MKKRDPKFVCLWVYSHLLNLLINSDPSGLEPEDIEAADEVEAKAAAKGLYFVCPMTEAELFEWEHEEEAPADLSREEYAEKFGRPSLIGGPESDVMACWFERK